MSRKCVCGQCKVTYIPDKVDWSRDEYELDAEATQLLFDAVDDGNRVAINKATEYANKVMAGPPRVLDKPYWSR